MAGAQRYTVPPRGSSYTTTIPNYADARLTDVSHPAAPGEDDYRRLPYQKLAFGRVCTTAVAVFFRSSRDVHPDREVVRLFGREAALVRSTLRC